MKKLIIILFIFQLYASNAQTVLIVDNTPGAPTGSHIFSNFADAINAAVEGDIIHIMPSGVSYGSITIPVGKNGITVYGVGVNPDKETLVRSVVELFTVNGNNIKVGGLVVNSEFRISWNATSALNVTVENMQFNSNAYASYNTSSDGILFRNCVFYSSVITTNISNNVVFSNCIFSYSINNATGQVFAENGTIFNNCLFYGNGASRYGFTTLNNSIVSNSIFYGRSPLATSSTSNSTFNHCFAQDSHNTNEFPTASGTNTLNNIIPYTGMHWLQDSTIAVGLFWNMDNNVMLNPNFSALINGGNDGNDIGLTGGTIPFNKTASSLPYVKSILMPTIIRQGDQLNVSFDAKGN